MAFPYSQTLASLLMFASTAVASAHVLTFDDVPVSQLDAVGSLELWAGFVQNGYAGFNWTTDTWVATPGWNLPTWGFGNVPDQVGNYIWNNGGFNLAFSSAESGNFDFNSLLMRKGATEARRVTLFGYRNDSLLYRKTVDLTDLFKTYEFHFEGVDEVRIVGDHAQYLLDDLNVSRHVVTSPVPEPSQALLFLSGLVAVAWQVRGSRNEPVLKSASL